MLRAAIARVSPLTRGLPSWCTPGLDAEVLSCLRRLFPDLAPQASVRYRRLSAPSWHEMLVAQAGRDRRHRLLLKGPGAVQSQAVRERQVALMALEHRLLTQVAPRISAANPEARCPEVAGYDPERPLLAMEMVDGRDLRSLLFGRGPAPSAPGLLSLLRLCGQWLASFHEFTQRPESGNPLAWLGDELEAPAARRLLDRAVGSETCRTLHALARDVRARHQGLRTPLCMVHGVFAPYHVLVQEGRIYVVDLESSHVGYPCEDLALFVGYYDVLLPWRRARGAARVSLDQQRRAFLDAYRRRPEPGGGGEEAVAALARLHAVMRIACYRAEEGRHRSARSRLLRPWLLYRLRVVTREILPVLRREATTTALARG